MTAGILSFQGRSPSFSGVVKEDKKNSTVFLCVFMGLLFGGGVTVALFSFFHFSGVLFCFVGWWQLLLYWVLFIFEIEPKAGQRELRRELERAW